MVFFFELMLIRFACSVFDTHSLETWQLQVFKDVDNEINVFLELSEVLLLYLNQFLYSLVTSKIFVESFNTLVADIFKKSQYSTSDAFCQEHFSSTFWWVNGISISKSLMISQRNTNQLISRLIPLTLVFIDFDPILFESLNCWFVRFVLFASSVCISIVS